MPQELSGVSLYWCCRALTSFVVTWPVRLHLTIHPDEPGWRVENLFHLGRRSAAPAGTGDQKVCGASARGTFADGRENVAPHVEKRDDVVASVGIWNREDQGLLIEIHPGNGK